MIKLKIDYISCTSHSVPYNFIVDYLKLDKHAKNKGAGSGYESIREYNGAYIIGENGATLSLLTMKGEACTDYESRANIIDLLKWLKHGFKFTRIDIAYDVITFNNDKEDEIVPLPKFLSAVKSGYIECSARKKKFFQEDDGNIVAQNVTIGTNKSRCQLGAYDKLAQLKQNKSAFDSNIKSWYRYEFRLFDDLADLFVVSFHDNEFNTVAKSFALNFIKVKNKNGDYLKDWDKMLSLKNDVSKIDIQKLEQKRSEIQQKKMWLENCAATSLLLVMLDSGSISNFLNWLINAMLAKMLTEDGLLRDFREYSYLIDNVSAKASKAFEMMSKLDFAVLVGRLGGFNGK